MLGKMDERLVTTVCWLRRPTLGLEDEDAVGVFGGVSLAALPGLHCGLSFSA